MSLLATQVDFEQGGLYGHPDGTGSYQQYVFFQTRVNGLIGRAAPNNQKLAIWGCGWGYLVSLCVTAGYDAYGFDASSYAITKGKTVLPGIANRLFIRNALVSSDVTASKSDAGIHGKSNFALLVTEDLLTCMSDAEINTSVPLLRGISQSNLLHVLSSVDDGGSNLDPRINWKTKAAWAALLEPPDVCVDPNGTQF